MESRDSPGSLSWSSGRNTTLDAEYFPAKVGSHRAANPEDNSFTMEVISGLASETRNTSQSSMLSLNANNPHSSQRSQILVAPFVSKSSMKAIPNYVTIILDCGEEFYIERALLNLTSEYFAANFRNHDIWIESNSGKIQLPNIREHTFAVFHEWLETGKIDSVQPPSQNPDSREKSTPTPSLFAPVLVNVLAGNKDEIFPIQIGVRLDLLIECYTLGNYVKAPAFQNMLIDEIILEYYNFHCNNNGIPLHNLPFICTATIKSSPLNRLVHSIRGHSTTSC